jgi:hypothetical protein
LKAVHIFFAIEDRNYGIGFSSWYRAGVEICYGTTAGCSSAGDDQGLCAGIPEEKFMSYCISGFNSSKVKSGTVQEFNPGSVTFVFSVYIEGIFIILFLCGSRGICIAAKKG